MTIVPIALASKSSPTRNGQEGVSRLVNCYAESTEDAKNPFAIYAKSGTNTLITVASTGPVRAMLSIDTALIAVMGRVIVQIDAGFGSTTLGGIASDGIVTMARNRKAPNPQVGIVCDGLFRIVENGVLTEVTDADLAPPISICSLDGYFILFCPDGRFYVTTVDEGTEIDALDFATAEANPDGGVRNVTRGRDAVFFGTRSVEFWQSVSGGDFPFSRVTTKDVGCYAGGSVVAMTAIQNKGPAIDTVIWAGTNKDGAPCGVVMLSGYEPVKISTGDIDRLIADEDDPAAITAYAWTEAGHSFYSISGEEWTRVYDATEGLWHDETTAVLTRVRYRSYAHFASKHIVGDYETGTLYEQARSINDEEGEEIVMSIETPPVHASPYRMKWKRVFVDVVRGVGLNSTSDELANPSIMLDYSEDGGATYSAQRMLPIGAAAQTRTAVEAWRMGQQGKNLARTFRLSMSASVARAVMSLSGDVDREAA